MTDYAAIVRYGVLRTPSVVIDGKLVHSGGVPTMRTIERWLEDAAASATVSKDASART